MKLYGYWRSSAAYRVRIALHLKDVEFESISVHLVKNGGEQHNKSYVELNPTHLVPTLVDGNVELRQSMAILDYINEKHKNAPLYPKDIIAKAHVQSIALDVACEIHPLNNLRVQQYLVNQLSATDDEKLSWTHHWMKISFQAIEAKLIETAGLYSFGDQITMADICLVPQVYNAYRFSLDMSEFPTIVKVVDNCNKLSAFERARPECQPDAQL